MSEILSKESRYPNFALERFLAEHDIDFKTNDGDDHTEISINCPECHNNGEETPDRNKKLWINKQTYHFHCFRCDYNGTMPQLVRKLLNVNAMVAMRILRGDAINNLDYLNLKLYDESFKPFESSEDGLRETDLPFGYSPITRQHPYLKKRGVPLKYAIRNQWGISEAGFTKNRIIVPFFMHGKLVFWQARATWDEPGNKEFKKVLNPKGLSARSVLYNYDVASRFEEVILVEGFMDAVKSGPRAMATNGKRLHAQQCELLVAAGVKSVIMAWDADAWSDGKMRNGRWKPCSMQRAVLLLRTFGLEVRCVKFKAGIDPGKFEYRSEELQEIFKNAKEPKFKTILP